MSEQYTITAGHILHVLVSSRGYADIDQRHISAALKAALANYQGQGVRYGLDSAVLASRDAGYTLATEEIAVLARLDATASVTTKLANIDTPRVRGEGVARDGVSRAPFV